MGLGGSTVALTSLPVMRFGEGVDYVQEVLTVTLQRKTSVSPVFLFPAQTQFSRFVPSRPVVVITI